MTDAVMTPVRKKVKLAPPSKWNVIFLNDDTTPMEFVITVLVNMFNHSYETAEEIMLSVHHVGRGVAGTYPYEVAEQKLIETLAFTKSQGYSLQVEMQKE